MKKKGLIAFLIFGILFASIFGVVAQEDKFGVATSTPPARGVKLADLDPIMEKSAVVGQQTDEPQTAEIPLVKLPLDIPDEGYKAFITKEKQAIEIDGFERLIIPEDINFWYFDPPQVFIEVKKGDKKAYQVKYGNKTFDLQGNEELKIHQDKTTILTPDRIWSLRWEYLFDRSVSVEHKPEETSEEAVAGGEGDGRVDPGSDTSQETDGGGWGYWDKTKYLFSNVYDQIFRD